MSKLDKVKLVNDVMQKAFDATESFGPWGESLCYLSWAITSDSKFEASIPEMGFYYFLQSLFLKDHEVWNFVELIESENGCKSCGIELSILEDNYCDDCAKDRI